MAHKHVWKLNPQGDQRYYKLALLGIENLIDTSYMVVGNSRGDPNSEPYTKTFIIFNGIVPFIAEHFYLPKQLSAAEAHYSCYTNGQPYDCIVKACLVILYEYIGDDIQIFSDGDIKDWQTGIWMAGGGHVKLKSMEDFYESKF